MSSKSLAAAEMAQAVGHESNYSDRVWAATPLEADYTTDHQNPAWVGETLAELRSDASANNEHRLNARTKVMVELSTGTHTTGAKNGVTSRHLFLHSPPGQPREWHPTDSVAIVEDPSGSSCRVSLDVGSQELSWTFSKEEGDFFFVPDELLQVVETADMCAVEACGRSVFSGNVLPASFRTLGGKMSKVWATSNVVPDELYGCYDETSDPYLLDAFGLVRYRACEVTDPVGWEVEQTDAGTPPDDDAGREKSVALQIDHLPWLFPDATAYYPRCQCVKEKAAGDGETAACTSGTYVYDHSTNTIRPMEKQESYIAISYTWAEYPVEKHWPMQRAIDQLREKTNTNVFWIDRFSINQNCKTHKAEQIPKMGHIYSNASHVACLLPGVSHVLPAAVRNPNMVMRRRDFSQATAPFRAQAKASPWFRRVWTWQEGLLATRSTFVTQNDILDGWLVDNILNATRLARCGHVSHMPALPASSGIQSLRSLAASSDMQLLYTRTADDSASRELRYSWGTSGKFTLMGAAVATRRRSAGRKVDEVYGLLGMVERGGRMPVSSDEDNTVEKILTEALKIGLMTTEVLSGASVSKTSGRGWLPDIPVQKESPHFALQLGQLNRGGYKMEGNEDGMAVVTGATMPKGCRWTRDDGDGDAKFKLRSSEGQILASSNDVELAKHLEKPMLFLFLDDVLSGDCYGTFAMLEEADQIARRRITSCRLRVESAGFRMKEGTCVVVC